MSFQNLPNKPCYMAASVSSDMASTNHNNNNGAVLVVPINNEHEKKEEQNKQKQTQEVVMTEEEEDKIIDYSQRAQWLRAAVMGATDGLVSVASLMIGVGAVRTDAKPMLLAGFAGSVAGGCSMAIGEFVSVYTQYEVEVSQMKRKMSGGGSQEEDDDVEMRKKALPNPWQAALASASSYCLGAVAPLVGAAFIRDYRTRIMVVLAVATLALFVFGWIGSVLGNTPMVKSCARVLLGGWMAMAITFGLTKLFAFTGLQ
ncbi:Vacuolar iron transporter 1 [Stylosanthes scabra]|uniref:Vacuolar iron transporter n=1 Tax=Stylosanthes scabra TaxID=79078 RepID=A0ABU6SCA7_9FABA|nr:Vacuolar iron transporter 1 [Stylosanthes scabra]